MMHEKCQRKLTLVLASFAINDIFIFMLLIADKGRWQENKPM